MITVCVEHVNPREQARQQCSNVANAAMPCGCRVRPVKHSGCFSSLTGCEKQIVASSFAPTVWQCCWTLQLLLKYACIRPSLFTDSFESSHKHVYTSGQYEDVRALLEGYCWHWRCRGILGAKLSVVACSAISEFLRFHTSV